MLLRFIFLPPDYLSDVMVMLTQCLETMAACMGRNRLWLNPSKMKWLWIFETSVVRIFHPWFRKKRHCFRQTHCTIWKSSWTHSSCLMSRRQPFLGRPLQTFVDQLHLFLNQAGLLIVTHSLVTSCLDCYNTLHTILPRPAYSALVEPAKCSSGTFGSFNHYKTWRAR